MKNCVKYKTLLAFAPTSDDVKIFTASADPFCISVRNAASFALRSADESRIDQFLAASVPVMKKKKGGQQAVLALISRGQSRAHDILQRDIVPMFLQSCPIDCPLRPDSKATAEVKRKFADMLVRHNLHIRSESYADAWFHACVVAISKARITAMTTADDIEEIFPDLVSELEPVWIKQENMAQEKYVEMSIAGFAFVVTKVRPSYINLKVFNSLTFFFFAGNICSETSRFV